MVPLRTLVRNSELERMEASKNAIRKEILYRRKQLRPEERKKASVMLTERILGHQWYYLSEYLLGFFPYGSEPDICEILSDALRKGKKVYLPRVMGTEMEFFRVNSLQETAEGYKGIMEPAGDTERYVYDETKARCTLMLMPGVAFDSNRNRIGYGKGFYDRYLQEKAALQIRTIAVAYQCQMVEQIPSEVQDVRPYQIISV